MCLIKKVQKLRLPIRNSNDVQQLLKHLPDLEAKHELTFVLQDNEANDLHEHYLYTWAWTLILSKIKSTNCSCSSWCLYPSQHTSDFLIRGRRWGSTEKIIVEVAADQNEIINPWAKINNNLQAWYPPVITPIGRCKGSSVQKLKKQHKFIHFQF